MIDDILKFNAAFVAGEEYRKFETSKFPDKKIAIVTCMDTRLVELLPAALGIRNGDVKMIKMRAAPLQILSIRPCVRFLWLSMSLV